MKARLGDYVNIKTGKLDANAAVENGAYPFFTCAVDPLRIDSFSFDCECVLVAGNGDLNVKYYEGKFDAYQRTYIIESKNKEVLTVPYLYFFLDKYVEILREQAIGGVIKYIKIGNLTEAQIELVPLKEQAKIVENLNKIYFIICRRKQQLEKLDILVKSKFIEMFGDFDLNNVKADWEKISSVAEVVSGSTPKTEKDEFWGGEFYWITPAEISEKSFIIKTTQRTLTYAGVKSCSLSLLPVGTVLLSSRAPIGKVAIAGAAMYCNQGFKNLICTEAVNPIYVYFLLKFNSDYLNSLGRGATFKEISKSIVDNIAIPVPPIELQKKLAFFVEGTEKFKSTIVKSLEKLETLKKALMQKYFG